MTKYLIYFNQQWVGDHSAEWFASRAPLAMAVIDEMKAAGVYVFAGGLEEQGSPLFTVASADATSGTLTITDGPYAETTEQISGYFHVTCDDHDALVEAAQVLTRAHPVVEIRPVEDD